MPDDIIKPSAKILSLDEARAEATRRAAQKDPELIGEAGLKRNASKEFVLETATQIALGACQRTYDAMSEQQAEGLAKCEAMCLQHVEALRWELRAAGLLPPASEPFVLDEPDRVPIVCGAPEPGRTDSYCALLPGHDGPHTTSEAAVPARQVTARELQHVIERIEEGRPL